MIKKVVLTGGPCSGKSTSIAKIKRYFEEMGFIVLIVPETATELIESGIKPFEENGIDLYEFQKYVFMKQLSKENIIDIYLKEHKNKDIIVLYDRSLIDNKSYVSQAEFNKLLKEFNLTENQLIEKYDLAIHLLTAAAGTDFYTLENNKARSESKEEAILQDNKTLKCYLGFPHHIMIDNSTNFDEKVKRVINEVSLCVNGKVTNIKQNKYLISDIDNDFLEKNARRINITQTYLNKYDKDVMVRKIDYGDSESYYVSIKTPKKNGENIVTERVITEKDYLDLTSEKSDFLTKERYCFEIDGTIYKLDIFPNNLMILETEGFKDIKSIPSIVKVEKDVTLDKNYRNKNIAQNINKLKYKIN